MERRRSRTEEPAPARMEDLPVLLRLAAAERDAGPEVGRRALLDALRAVFRRRYPGHEVVAEMAGGGRPVVRLRPPDGEWRDVSAEIRQLRRQEARTFAQVFRQRLVEEQRAVRQAAARQAVGEAVRAEVVQYLTGGWEVELPLAESRVRAWLPRREALPADALRTGDRVWVYVVQAPGPGAFQAQVSRTHPGLARRLLERNVPEVADGTVEVVGVAREPGVLCKVAVRSRLPEVDPVGAVIGLRGERVRAIAAQLGEPVEVHHFPPGATLEEQLAAAMEPVPVVAVDVDAGAEGGPRATVWVEATQVTAAIGSRGVRAKLAARLCGLCKVTVECGREVQAG